MDLLLGLPGLVVREVVETFEEVCITAEIAADPPTCPSCSITMRPHAKLVSRFWDSPMRGKRCSLLVQRRRFKCRCKKTVSELIPDIAEADFPSLTFRLARYIENQSIRRNAPVIARETGVSETMVRRLVDRLAYHLWHNHRFPTPLILGIDDLRIRKQLFTNVTDARTGHSIALVEGGEADVIVRELQRRKLNPFDVSIVVSDMGGSNIGVFTRLFGSRTIHVADKWHVLKGAKEALRAVINKRIDHLRRKRAYCEKIYKKRGTLPVINKQDPFYKTRPAYRSHPLTRMQHRIDELRDAKPKLLGMRRPFYA
jgi:transposase